MNFMIRQSNPTTLVEAVKATQSFIDIDVSSAKSKMKKKNYQSSFESLDNESETSEESSKDDPSDMEVEARS